LQLLFKLYQLLSSWLVNTLHGDGAFPVDASQLWNTLSLNVTSASSLSVFWIRLKTHLFSHSFLESPVVPAQWLCHFGHFTDLHISAPEDQTLNQFIIIIIVHIISYIDIHEESTYLYHCERVNW